MKVITIGRGYGNDVQVDDPYVSRHHIQIIEEGGQFRITDFGSSNGTFVDGQPISGEIPISKDSVIRIGNTTIPWQKYFRPDGTSIVQPTTPIANPIKEHADVDDDEDTVESLSLLGYWCKCLKKYVSFSGRARRKEYWGWVLFNEAFVFAFFALLIVLALLIDSPANLILFPIGYIAYILYSLATFLPNLSVLVRRMHDLGKSGWMLMVSLIPIAGSIWMLVLLCSDSEIGENEYGPNPKGIDC